MGQEDGDVASQSPWAARRFTFASEDEQVDFDIVMYKYNYNFFPPKRNVVHVRACFLLKCSTWGKAEAFVRGLDELAEHFDFGANRDEHIRGPNCRLHTG